jgi:hypothetical protein
MPIDAVMTTDERRKYLYGMQQRYQRGDKAARKSLLDEMEEVTHLHRKSLIRLMGDSLERQPRRDQRGRSYAAEVDDALRLVAESYDYLCAERLTPDLVTMVEQLAAHHEIQPSLALLEQLSRISVSTVQRILKRIGQDQRRRPRRPPGSANAASIGIPMRRIAWDEKQPGHFEIDLTHHCGPSASGDFLHTLQMIDVTTGWSERAATLGRSFLVMRDAFQRIQARIPIPVLELHPDNGSEFLNWNMLRFWKDVFPGVQFSRSFPYHKNDNRFVEQKNSSLVRAYLGYDRLDSVAQVQVVNQLYDNLWVYNNLFQPVMRLKEKVLVPSPDHPDRPHIKRIYDTAKTPFDRLCETDAIQPARRQALLRLRDQTNPRQLRKEIYALIDHLFTLAPACPGEYEDVARTLFMPLPADEALA